MISTVMLLLFQGLDHAPQVSTPVLNPGVRSHTVFIQFEGCTVPGPMSFYLEASFDKLTWTRFGPEVTNMQTANTVVGTVGAFPYIRAHARAFDTANCRLTAYYSASTADTTIIDVSGSKSPMFVDMVNLSTGNAKKYVVGHLLSIIVRGPANAQVRETGVFNGNPFDRVIGYTDASGYMTFTEAVSQPGVYDTQVRIGGGSPGGLRLTREVTGT